MLTMLLQIHLNHVNYKYYANNKDLRFVVFDKAYRWPTTTMALVNVGPSCQFEFPSRTTLNQNPTSLHQTRATHYSSFDDEEEE